MSDWRPSATLDVLKLRARMLGRLREFFSTRGVLEVETPALSVAATTDLHLQSFSCRTVGPAAGTLYLHTSPEFPMKRLLAAGSGSIYQICKVFRDGEAGRLHNPEFTMLEWYRTGYDTRQLMEEVDALVQDALGDSLLLAATEHLSYQEVFERHTGLDPHTATAAEFTETARRHEIHPPAGMTAQHDVAMWRDLLLTHLIEPHLGQGRLTFICDYPASQAALARVRPGNLPVAERFELYLHGIELANGFHELADDAEQRTRFERQLHARVGAGQSGVPLDEHLLGALAAGLPDCSGVALGLDRLVMLAAGARNLGEVIAFTADRA